MGLLTRSGDVLFFMLFLRLKTGICQVRVEASVGDSVLLPCVYNATATLPSSASVFWRDRDDNVVLNIKQRAPDYSTQDARFRGRVSSDRDQNQNQNFSIVMKEVRSEDRGTYECHIPNANFLLRVSLTVTENRVQVQTTPSPGVGPSGGVTAVTPTVLHVLLLLVSLTWTCLK